jgi:hypothetical protein
MKKVMLLFLIILLNSCQYFEKNVPAKNDLLNKELKKINWEEVDEFPSVIQCDSIFSNDPILDKQERKKCFFDYLTNNFQEVLISDSIKIKFPKLDTIPIKATVFANGSLKTEPNLLKYKSIYNIKELDSIIKCKLPNMFAGDPAIKRGENVNSQFILSIILPSASKVKNK